MSLSTRNVDRTLGYIASLRTLIDNYPELKYNTKLLNLLNSNTPMGFIMNLLVVCGVSETDLLNMISKILCGQYAMRADVSGKKIGEKFINISDSKVVDNGVSNGILDSIEEAVRVLILSNIKNICDCSLNPIIPDDVLKYPYRTENISGLTDPRGIEISVPTIDMFNTLRYAPNSNYGKNLYFDNAMGLNDAWQSEDFNVFLWYIINRSTNIDEEILKNVWDNRIRRRKHLSNKEFRKNFFNVYAGNNTYIKHSEEKEGEKRHNVYTVDEDDKRFKKSSEHSLKKQFLMLEYNERSSTHSTPDVLTIWLNAYKYRTKQKKDGVNIYINKPVFAFNYDYVYSLKLFNSKTIVSQVINSLLGVFNSSAAGALNVKYTLQQEIISDKVKGIVKRLMQEEETVINDCYFSFSNDEYNALLEDAELKFKNNYKFGETTGETSNLDVNEINNYLSNIENSATLEEVQTNIFETLNFAVADTAEKNSMIEEKDKLSFSYNIIFNVVELSVTHIVLQVLSPKVMMLYALNSYFMGDITDTKNLSPELFLRNLPILISTITKQVFDMIMREIMKYLMEQLNTLLIIMAQKIISENLFYYIEMLRRLLALYDMFFNNKRNRSGGDIVISDVSPEIIATKKEPTTKKC